jgi:hypothetical protein
MTVELTKDELRESHQGRRETSDRTLCRIVIIPYDFVDLSRRVFQTRS